MNVLALPPDLQAELLADGRRSIVPRGALIYTPGDATDCVYVVNGGRIKIVRTSPSGSEAIVGIRNPGDLFGELMWLTPGSVRATSAIALDQSDICRLDADAFDRRLARNAALAAAFARGIALRLADIELELTEREGKSVPGRLIDALGRLASDHGVSEPEGAVRIGISLTHKDLADLIGTSRETLTRELSVLADIGLLRVAQRTIVLLQPRAFPLRKRR